MKREQLFLLAALCVGCANVPKVNESRLRHEAETLAKRFIIVDTHIDVPYRLREKTDDVSVRTLTGDFDYPRAIVGGLNAPFMSIYTPADLEEKGGAKTHADSLISIVQKIASDNPAKFAIAYSVADVTNQFGRGIVSLPMGMENGSPIEGKLENIKYFYDRGIRYITLAHGKSNHISDSSYDKDEKWNGISPFGEKVVLEMNRLGIMVDVSHITDSAFYDVMRVSHAPVIASHSSCRSFTPGWQRNISDDMIKLLASNAGVVCINFGSDFISDEYRRRDESRRDSVLKYFEEHNIERGSEEGRKWEEEYSKGHPIAVADVKDVAAHIDHVVKLVGVDYVGIGSDFDGVGDSLPTGLKDVSQYPNLICELLKMDYTESDIRKICGGNVLRVWSRVEEVARQFRNRTGE
jgi:membrane dipeptidase